MSTARRRRGHAPASVHHCVCGHELKRYWSYCPNCGRAQQWKDEDKVTGAECFRCGWVVSDRFSYCPWCDADIYEEGYSSETPLKAPFQATTRATATGSSKSPARATA